MAKGPVITYERHDEIGKMLYEMRNNLVHLYVEVANSHRSKRQHQVAVALNTALNRIDRARSELEEVMFSDHPSAANTHVYYRSNRKEEDDGR